MSQSIHRDHAAPRGGADLPVGWRALRDCNLSGRLRDPVIVPLVLIHPDVGVALVETGAADAAPDAEAVLRARLGAARFDGIFPGYLPIAHVAVPPAQLPALDGILAEAFAVLPPLSLPGGDAWASVVERALALRDARRAPPRLAEEPAAQQRQGLAPGPAGHAPFIETPAPVGAPSFMAGQGAARGWSDGQPPQRPPMLREPVFLRRHDPEAERDVPPEPEPVPEAPQGASRPWPWALAGLAAGAAIGGAMAVLLPSGVNGDAGSGASAPPVAAQAGPPAPAPADLADRPPALAAAPATPQPPAPPAPAAAPEAPRPPPAAVAEPPIASAARDPTVAVPATVAGPELLPLVSVRTPANLRRGPGTSSPVIRTTRRGETFHVHGTAEGEWMEVGDARATVGWIHGSLLREVPR